MTTAETLLRFGIAALQAGAMVWIGLILWLALRHGGWGRLTGWSVDGQFAELGRLIRLAGQGGAARLLSRAATLAIAAGAAALALAGLHALLRLFTEGRPG
jgi:hypothetical protein